MCFWKILARAIVVAFALLSGATQAQQLFGVNAQTNDSSAGLASNGLFLLSYNTGAITGGRIITVPTRTITGSQSITVDPTTGVVYAVVKATGVSGRLLITVDTATGAGVEIGNLGDAFSSIAFRSNGQLFGVTGDGATVPETLYLIDKAAASKVIARALGNGIDGEVIAYNPDDDSFYHWSGDGIIVFERVLASAPYTITDIPITGASVVEIFGAVWDPTRSKFMVTNLNGIMDFWTTAGVRSDAQPAAVSAARGLALPLPPLPLPTLGGWKIALIASLWGIAALAAARRRDDSLQ